MEELAKEYARQSYLHSEENHPKEDVDKALSNLVAYHHQELQKARLEGLHAGIKRVAYYLEHKPRCYLYNEEGDASQCDCGLKEASHSELDQPINSIFKK